MKYLLACAALVTATSATAFSPLAANQVFAASKQNDAERAAQPALCHHVRDHDTASFCHALRTGDSQHCENIEHGMVRGLCRGHRFTRRPS